MADDWSIAPHPKANGSDRYSSYISNDAIVLSIPCSIASPDGRHLAMMPHLERAIFPWQCGYYPYSHRNDDVTPWIDAFVNARKWVESKTKK